MPFCWVGLNWPQAVFRCGKGEAELAMHLFWVSGITSVYSYDITSCPHVDVASGILLLPSMLTHPSSQHKGSEPEVIW